MQVAPGEMLADLLRYRLGLTGTKIACNEAECGACTVILDGEPVLSCIYPAIKADGRTIMTIEGLADSQESDQPAISGLHPLQQAFIQNGAVQCGFCIPGQIMTAFGLLQHNLNPTEDEIKHALKDTLCRCAGYPAIIRSVQQAACIMRGEKPETTMAAEPAAQPGKAVGAVWTRSDAAAKVTGKAIYTDDLTFPGMLHARVKRAQVPSGILRSLNVEKARCLPGVVTVLTAVDIPAEHNHGLVTYDWPVMIAISERIRTVGDALALVAAETREIATQALELIEFEYDPRAVISNPIQSRQPDSEQIHRSGNLLKHIEVRKGNIEQGFAEADVILERTYYTPVHEHAFMEPECSIAQMTPAGQMEIYVGSQIPYADREQVARVFGWPEERVRIIGQLIGGGFGGKEDIAGQIHAALLAHATGRPVKLLFDRHESMLVHPKRHATQIRIKAGAKKEGRLTAVETELYGDTGAYASLGEKVMTRATTHSCGPYEIPHVKADCFAMYSNNPPAGAFRGFGVMQATFAIESLMDELAEKLGFDPVEIRRLNALKVGSVTNTGQILKNSVGLLESIDKVDAEIRRLARSNPFKPKRVEGDPEKISAWGFAVAYKNTGLGGGAPDKAAVEVELRSNGKFQVRSSSAELGQGLPTVLQLIAAEELNQLPQQIDVLLSDTDQTPDGGPTTASRQTFVTGNAVRHAAQALYQLLVSDLAECYDTPPERIRFFEGLVQVGERIVKLSDVAVRMISKGRQPIASYTYWAPVTRPLGEGGDMHFAYSFAAQAAEVEVNTRTGEVSVLRLVTANDVGYAINPLGLRGQIEGGAIMGIGHALTEEFIIKEGNVITDRLARYRIPSITLTPEVTIFVVENPVPEGPYGAKGVGEIVLIPTAPAITNAVYNAVGVRCDHLPVDQEKILLELKKRNNYDHSKGV